MTGDTQKDINGNNEAAMDEPRTLYIPEGVTKVVSLMPFSPKDDYERIVFPASVEEIPDDSLHVNTTVREVIFLSPHPGDYGTGLRYIGDNAFRDMSSLEKVILPPTLEEIGKHAFVNCFSLREINLPSSLLSIGAGAFRCCHSLESITLPENLRSLGCEALGCQSLKKMTIMCDIPLKAGDISGCYRLESIESPYYRLENGMVIHNGSGRLIWRMEDNASEVTIPEGVTEIGESAFEEQDMIKKITLPSTLREIGQKAFAYCSRLSAIGCCKAAVSKCDDNAFRYGSPKAVFPPSLRKIGRKAFTSCNGMRVLVLHEGIDSVGESAFFDCMGLESIRIGNPGIDMWNDAFAQCHSLFSVVLPEGMAKLPRGAFSSCSSLEKINLPSSLTKIGEDCFHGCHSLDVAVPEGASIGSRAFNSCRSIRIGGGARYFVKDGALYDSLEGSIVSVSRSCKVLSIPKGIQMMNPEVICCIGKETKCICIHDIRIDWRKFLNRVHIPMAIFPESMAEDIKKLYREKKLFMEDSMWHGSR